MYTQTQARMVYNFPSSTSLLCSAFEDAWVDDVIQMLKYKQTCTLSGQTPPIHSRLNKDLKSIQSIHGWTKTWNLFNRFSPNMCLHKMHIVPVILKTHIEPMIILWSVYAAGSSSFRNQESTQSQANKWILLENTEQQKRGKGRHTSPAYGW
jgi:hypothetical protein